MSTSPPTIKPNALLTSRGRQVDYSPERELIHELINQLTVADLCASQLRFTSSAYTLSALERAVENALRAAKLLAAEIATAQRAALERAET